MTDNTLQAALARIKPGDEVTVRLDYSGHEGKVSGEVWEVDGELYVLTTLLRYASGVSGHMVREVLSHTPAPPPSATDYGPITLRTDGEQA